METITIAQSPSSIFFSTEKTAEQVCDQGILNAKLELIANIFKIKGFGGFVPSWEDFIELLDMNIDLLHMEVVRAEDWLHDVRDK